MATNKAKAVVGYSRAAAFKWLLLEQSMCLIENDIAAAFFFFLLVVFIQNNKTVSSLSFP